MKSSSHEWTVYNRHIVLFVISKVLVSSKDNGGKCDYNLHSGVQAHANKIFKSVVIGDATIAWCKSMQLEANQQ